jgi:hypothetical protein
MYLLAAPFMFLDAFQCVAGVATVSLFSVIAALSVWIMSQSGRSGYS